MLDKGSPGFLDKMSRSPAQRVSTATQRRSNQRAIEKNVQSLSAFGARTWEKWVAQTMFGPTRWPRKPLNQQFRSLSMAVGTDPATLTDTKRDKMSKKPGDP